MRTVSSNYRESYRLVHLSETPRSNANAENGGQTYLEVTNANSVCERMETLGCNIKRTGIRATSWVVSHPLLVGGAVFTSGSFLLAGFGLRALILSHPSKINCSDLKPFSFNISQGQRFSLKESNFGYDNLLLQKASKELTFNTEFSIAPEVFCADGFFSNKQFSLHCDANGKDYSLLAEDLQSGIRVMDTGICSVQTAGSLQTNNTIRQFWDCRASKLNYQLECKENEKKVCERIVFSVVKGEDGKDEHQLREKCCSIKFGSRINCDDALNTSCQSKMTLPRLSVANLEGKLESGYDYPYLHSDTSGYTNNNWMSAIPNDFTLSQFSIPGTHNSLSLYGGDASQTQSLDITEQLNMGIRYLDVRFKYREEKLIAYHGAFSQYLTFEELLGKVSFFLGSHPSETVLIRMQNEDGAGTDAQEFFNRFKQIVDKYRQNNVIPVSNNPTLGSVRGKFVFIRDFNVFKNKIGIERARMHIQDAHEFTSNWDLYAKWEKVKAHFHSITGKKISLNYLSGSTWSFPYFVASGKSSSGTTAPQLWTGFLTLSASTYPDFPRGLCVGKLCSINFAGTNQLTSAWIEKGSLSGNLGIVAMDFPGGRLVDNIIQSNAELIWAHRCGSYKSELVE